MTVGIVSYMSQRGLGTMCHDMRAHLGIDRQLVIPDGDWTMYLPWANGEEFYLHQWEIQREDLEAWKATDGIDTLISIETSFGDNTFKWAKELGMRTILVVMWEAFNPHLPAYRNVDLYVCPSYKAYQEVPFENRAFLPYPVDTDEFAYHHHREGPARVFVHNAGSGGMSGRKGTREAIEAFTRANVPGCTLLVCAQRNLQDICGIDGINLPQNIKVSYGPIPERRMLYELGDVLIYTSHYDGHALVTLEGMAAGMPVIVTDAEPMNEYWPIGRYPLAVRVGERQYAGTVNPHCLANKPDIDDIAEKIRWCATNSLGEISAANRKLVEEKHSWAVLRDRWKAKLGI